MSETAASVKATTTTMARQKNSNVTVTTGMKRLRLSPSLVSGDAGGEVVLVDVSDADVRAALLGSSSSAAEGEKRTVVATIKSQGFGSDDAAATATATATATAAVMCTATRSFSLRSCETSNELLLVDAASWDAPGGAHSGEVGHDADVVVVAARAGRVVEPQRTLPKYGRLNALLAPTAVRNHDTDAQNEERERAAPRFGDLLDRVQASEAELRAKLAEMGSVTVTVTVAAGDDEERVRGLDRPSLNEAFAQVLLEMAAHGWTNETELDVGGMERALGEFPAAVVRHALLRHAATDDGEKTTRVDPVAVARFCAERVLEADARSRDALPLAEFEAKWRESLPDWAQAVPLATALAGVALQPTPDVVRYLPVDRLPPDPTGRLDRLFREKRAWTHDDIVPYLVGVEGLLPGDDPSSFLRKHARSTSRESDGARVYLSRFAV